MRLRDLRVLTLLVLATRFTAHAAEPSVQCIREVVQAQPAPELNSLFDNKSGWVGADAAYSVVLAPDRVLWLFGDTFVGKVKDGRRTDCVIVNNSIAIQQGRGKNATIEFLTGKTKDEKTNEDKPAAFFNPADGKGYLWPQAAQRIGKRLFIFLPRIERAGDGGAFGFRQVAQELAIIDNPDDPPAAWRSTQRKVPHCQYAPGHELSFGSAILASESDIFIYGYLEEAKGIGSKKLIVARVPSDRLEDFSAWQFRTAKGWSETAADASPLADGLASEFSVTPLPGGHGFVLVCTENGLSDRIVARFADAPEGPWSAPVLLYVSPETKKDKGVFCYSAKAHAWPATGDELVITYCQNTWEFAKAFESDEIYRPKFVIVTLNERR